MAEEKRGGYREGAGRKKQRRDYSAKWRQELQRAFDKKAKETGKTVFDVLCDELWSTDKKTASTRASYLKIASDIMVTKESHQTIEKHEIGPQIGLPPIKQPDKETIYPVKPKEFVN